ncbi:hypothetical protein NLM33_40850 [Bradyrhizobium sp. CCGUVB1N3]|uniref:hypothetical protein n=1 Tax=Bradyrhizobium sp. CCGUVB1N3 TaxID=2949629 RepID=UPI0020B277F2|nr:hypothetical protein [Bradyrhizobium sp. CCGUVB1N3]MCP3476553.1 hypothetical protein [Bradyrhizobium sp. CCGUVB1N3]
MLVKGRGAPDDGRTMHQHFVSRPIDKLPHKRSQFFELRTTLGKAFLGVHRVTIKIPVEKSVGVGLEVGKGDAREQPINKSVLGRATLEEMIVRKSYVLQEPNVSVYYAGSQSGLRQHRLQ